MPLRETRLEFWQSFNNYVLGHPKFTQKFTIRKNLGGDHYYYLKFGRTPYICLNAYAKEPLLAASIFIDNDQDTYDQFNRNRAQIEQEVCRELEWVPEGNPTKIIATRDNFDIYNRDQWPEACDWLMNMAIKLKDVIEEYDN